jgi:hypothetical protein
VNERALLWCPRSVIFCFVLISVWLPGILRSDMPGIFPKQYPADYLKLISFPAFGRNAFRVAIARGMLTDLPMGRVRSRRCISTAKMRQSGFWRHCQQKQKGSLSCRSTGHLRNELQTTIAQKKGCWQSFSTAQFTDPSAACANKGSMRVTTQPTPLLFNNQTLDSL